MLLALAATAAATYASIGFVTFPPNLEIGAMSAVAVEGRDNIYVLHRGPQPLLKFDKKGKFIKAWGEGLFKVAHGLRIDRAGNVWTTDNGNHLLRKFSADGQLLASLGEGLLKAPDDVVFASDGTLFVADAGNGRIAHLTPDGKLLGSFGRKGKAEGEIHHRPRAGHRQARPYLCCRSRQQARAGLLHRRQSRRGLDRLR